MLPSGHAPSIIERLLPADKSGSAGCTVKVPTFTGFFGSGEGFGLDFGSVVGDGCVGSVVGAPASPESAGADPPLEQDAAPVSKNAKIKRTNFLSISLSLS